MKEKYHYSKINKSIFDTYKPFFGKNTFPRMNLSVYE